MSQNDGIPALTEYVSIKFKSESFLDYEANVYWSGQFKPNNGDFVEKHLLDAALARCENMQSNISGLETYLASFRDTDEEVAKLTAERDRLKDLLSDGLEIVNDYAGGFDVWIKEARAALAEEKK